MQELAGSAFVALVVAGGIPSSTMLIFSRASSLTQFEDEAS